MKKLNPSLIGLLQALGVILYCALISGVLQIMGKTFVQPAIFFSSVVILTLLVFSAAVTGSIVFGYPAYLVLNKKIKEALSVLAFTLLYCLGIVILILILIVALG
jgi:uncharacterized membrane protein YbhN (UPF0104 family)